MANTGAVRNENDDIKSERTSEEEVLFRRIEKQKNEALGRNKVREATGRMFEEILKGEADIVDFLEFKVKKQAGITGFQEEKSSDSEENITSEIKDNVVNIGDYQQKTKETTDQELESKLAKVLINDGLKTDTEQVEEIRDLIKENTDTEEAEVKIEAKRTFLEIKSFREEHPAEVRKIQRENLAKKVEDEFRKKNQDRILSEKQEIAARDQANLIADVYYGNEGIKEEDLSLATDRGFAPEKTKIARLELQGVVGLLAKKPDKTKEILDRYKKNQEILAGLNLPFNEVAQYGVFDRIANTLDRGNTRTIFDLIQKGGWRQRFNNITQEKTNSLLEIDGGFVSRVNGQKSSEFAQNSIMILASPSGDFYGGIRNILRGVSGGGVEAPAIFNMPEIGGENRGSLGGGLSRLGNLVSGKIGGGLKNWMTSLGAGAKKGLASGFNGLGGAIKGLTNAIPQVKAAKTAATAAVMIIGVIVGVLILSGVSMSQISTLPPPIMNAPESDYSSSGSSGSTSLMSCANSGKGLNIDNIFDKIDISTITTKIPKSAYVYKTDGSKAIDFSCLEKGLPEKGTNKRVDILKAAYALLGVPYFMTGGHGTIASGIDPVWGTYRKASSQYGNDGRNYNGLDCSGFVRWVYKYVTGVNIGGLSGEIYKNAQPIDKSELIPGDIGYMPGHIGIFFGRGTDGKYYFIHSSGRGSKAGPQALGGVLISTVNFTKFARAKVNLQ